MATLDAALLRQVAPKYSGARATGQAQIIDAVGAVLADTLNGYQINTTLREAHFLAQICHESAGFCTTVEYASGDAYENRADLGNTQPGDGRRYKGRGLIQLTGRANYRRYGELLNMDLEGNPDLAADPATSLVVACKYWDLHGLNTPADNDDIETITRRINGGLNGLDSRRSFLQRAKAALTGTAPATEHPTLRRGAKGDAVTALQQALVAKGYEITVDGDFGPGTDAAIRKFQSSHGLTADGVVGPMTWQALA